ncbi:ubiquitin family protein [Dictyocaulus viviparus]|uniref:BCL2-associated athanogene 6 n=1 Tax=Dictyocaulus viviparus TaxID=29172 RepID=A0A0D8XF68_DICVI|nr:ubiquitin family protein [Dictyocaulus viviparus]
MIMKIRVKIMDQTDHHFEIDDQMLLSDFRLEIAERLHIPPERQRMIFAGHVLKMENNTLSACGLRDGHVVHLVERPADMPFPTQEREPTNVGGHSHFNNSRHGRLLQNIFGTGNGRDRVTYVIPFERNEFLSENSHIEELIQSALDGLPFLTSDQRRRFNYRWESNNILRIALPPQRPHHVASPSLERVALIETLLEQIAHFYRVVEVPGGITDRIDEFLEGSHIYNEENTAVLNEQLRADALSLEREPLTRSRLIDRLDDDERETEESDEHAARFQCVEGLNGSPSYVMRHAITLDLVNILRRLQNENERLHSHLIRFERILNSRILYNINDADHTDSDYRANFFTVYMEHMQRMLHRLSHAWHLTSDLGVYLHNPIPRRLIPNYQNFQLLPPTESYKNAFCLDVGVDTSTRAESAALSGNSNSFAGQSDLTVSHGAHRGSTDDHISTIEGSSNPPPLPSNTHLSSLEEILIRTIEQSHPSLGSVNPYERIMRFILQSASNPNFDANSLFRSNSVQEAFSSTVARPENTFSSADPSQQSSSSSQIDQDALLSSSGSLARGVITQSGSQMPFMSESVPHSDASQVQSQLFNVSRSGVSTENGFALLSFQILLHFAYISRCIYAIDPCASSCFFSSRTHPTAVGYHVEVHQFDVFTQPVESDSNNQTSLQNPISSNTYTPSTSGNYNAHSNTMGSAPARGSLAQSRQRHYGLTNSTPLFMSNMSIPSEMHVSAPRQEVVPHVYFFICFSFTNVFWLYFKVVTVDPFLSCTSRFTDVQRILRNSYPNATTYLSPYRRFMRVRFFCILYFNSDSNSDAINCNSLEYDTVYFGF